MADPPGPRANPTALASRSAYVALLAGAIEDAARALPPPATARGGDDLSPGSSSSGSAATNLGLANPAPRASPRDGARWRVFAVSDIHADVPANMAWVRALPAYPPRSALVVAGDVATRVETLEACLRELKAKFEEVFFVPGNHELWTPPHPNPQSDEGLPSDSLGKYALIVRRCAALGVRVAPTLLRGAEPQSVPAERTTEHFGDQKSQQHSTRALNANARRHPNPSVLIVPVPSWYEEAFARDQSHRGYSPEEAHFDAGCLWPACVAGEAENARNSHAPGVAEFFNANLADAVSSPQFFAAVAPGLSDASGADSSSSFDVLTFSHFVPTRSLYRGRGALAKVMGAERVARRVAALGSVCHVFGHSHVDVDGALVDGTRYHQRALGYPNERWFGASEVTPALVWGPGSRWERTGARGGEDDGAGGCVVE